MDLPSGPHAAQVAELGDLPAANRRVSAALPAPPAARPDIVVYGYWPYWTDYDPQWLDGLTHLAVFQVGLNSDGSLNSQSRWTEVAAEVVAQAHAAGVQVHLCVTSFESGTMDAVLSSESRRAALVSNLAALVDAYGADGVNIDFEGMSSANKDQLTQLVQELKAVTPEVWLALPVIDWSRAYDYAGLAAVADGLFIMGYEFHGTWGNPGPNDPIESSDLWGSYNLSWSIDDYLAQGAPRASLVMGLPLYGHAWEVSSNAVPGQATGDAWAVFQDECDALLAASGRQWDEASDSPYSSGGGVQTWCDDLEATRLRVRWAVEEGIAGVGFWALGYEAAGFWEMMAEETVFADGGDGGGADTGPDTDGGAAGDGGAADGGGTEPAGQRAPGEAGGCATIPAGTSLVGGLLALGAVVRRRRHRAGAVPSDAVGVDSV